jgi:uncharacterized membrane protein
MTTLGLLVVATFLCSLVAGFLFAFAVVVMPGIKTLDDASFIRAFQVIDRVIQNNQPLFMLVWVGSALAIVAAAVVGFSALSGIDLALLLGAALVYILCVQVPTMAVNVPLNNALKRLDVSAMPNDAHTRARSEFESRWNQWNAIRTACACVTSLLLLLLLARNGT